MAFTVPVIGIFTSGVASGGTPQQRQARLAADIARSNEAWGRGFFPGVTCSMTFVAAGRFISTTTINSRSVNSLDDPRLVALIDSTKRQTNNATALYVVYVSGEFLTSSGTVVGIGGPRFKFFRSTTDYGLYGHIVMSDGALNTYALPHEAGHCLFGRFLNSSPNSFTINDPSNPGSAHNNNPQNLMFPTLPARNPFINSAQCVTARQSKIVLQNTSTARRKTGNNLQMVRKLNRAIATRIRYMKKTVVRRSLKKK